MIKCAQCETTLPLEANFCWKCGDPQRPGVVLISATNQSVLVDNLACRNCGHELDVSRETRLMCHYCGREEVVIRVGDGVQRRTIFCEYKTIEIPLGIATSGVNLDLYSQTEARKKVELAIQAGVASVREENWQPEHPVEFAFLFNAGHIDYHDGPDEGKRLFRAPVATTIYDSVRIRLRRVVP